MKMPDAPGISVLYYLFSTFGDIIKSTRFNRRHLLNRVDRVFKCILEYCIVFSL